ncbi:hypothetical protein BCEP4_650033 [Burkholderia cepacia]|nr:hypothetical protein BCEP4_650033 [Burkholderia cepacia]
MTTGSIAYHIQAFRLQAPLKTVSRTRILLSDAISIRPISLKTSAHRRFECAKHLNAPC